MADRRRDSRDRVRLTHLITTDPVSWHRVDTHAVPVHAYLSPRSARTAAGENVRAEERKWNRLNWTIRSKDNGYCQ